MSTVKLTFNGMTRKVQFPDEHPAWSDVSHRVETMFGIPAASVALSYVDADGDETYVSSNDELFDMFHTVTAQPQSASNAYRFEVHDMRQTKHKDDDSSSSSSSSISERDGGVPDFGERAPSRSTVGGGMGFGFAPFEMMFGHAATAASVKSPSQGHISPVPTPTELGMAAAEAGLTRSQFGRTVASSNASTIDGYDGNPAIHIQQPSSGAGSIYGEHAEPAHVMHPTPALYHDVANFIHALSGAVSLHPEVSQTFGHLLDNSHRGVYWDELAQSAEAQQAASHNLLGAVNSLLHTFFPPPPPRTPTQAVTPTQVAATPAYTAAGFELPPSVVAPDETPVPSRLNTPSVAPIPMVGSPAMSATSVPSTIQGPGIRPVLDMARADRASVRSDTDAGSVISGMGSPIRGTGPAWRFAGRSGGAPQWGLNTSNGAMVPAQQPQQQVIPADANKYVESRVKLEHMKEMYKQTKEEYRREREERKREKERKQQSRLITAAPEPIAPASHGDMFDKLNEALAQVPGRANQGAGASTTERKGIVPPPAASVAGSGVTEQAARTRQQLNNWLIEQLGDMGFSAATHPQVSRMVRDATRPYSTNAEAANENALLEDLLAQLVPTSSKV